MAARARSLDPLLRAAQKEASRDADARAMKSGRKSVGQVKRENASFGFSKADARINLGSARKLV